MSLPLMNEMHHNREAERVLLGAVVVDNSLFPALDAGLRTDDFYLLEHREVFEAVKQLHRRGRTIDLVSIRNELRDMRWPHADVAFLAGLVQGVPALDANQVSVYVGVVSDAGSLRRNADWLRCPICLTSYQIDAPYRSPGVVCGDRGGNQVIPCRGRLMQEWDYRVSESRADELVRRTQELARLAFNPGGVDISYRH